MCRLMFDPAPQDRGARMLEDQFTRLEEVFGGDGNGIALLGSGEEPIKGVRVRPSTLADAAMQWRGPIMFHTRKASMGGVVDSLCQPFYIPHNTYVAHNGHWGRCDQGLDILLKAGKMRFVPLNLSDSLIGAMLTRSYGPGVLYNYVGEGVWLYSRTKPSEDRSVKQQTVEEVLAVVNNGSFVVNLTNGQAASQPVYWKDTDDLGYVQANSVIQLYPKIKVLYGEMVNHPPGRKEKKKK